jgi:Ca2+-binding EF-hand superfamily protein
MAQLPLSQQSLNMAFHVLDKDRDGLISAAEAYKMVAFYLVRLQQQLQHLTEASHWQCVH